MDNRTPVIATIDHDAETMVRVVTSNSGTLLGRVDKNDASQPWFPLWVASGGEPIWVQVTHVVTIQKQRQ